MATVSPFTPGVLPSSPVRVPSSTTTLNYISFFTLYVICFAYLFRSKSGMVALGSLTFVHTASTIFIGFMMSDMLKNPLIPNQLITKIAIVSILLTVGMNLVALILIVLLLATLQTHYNATVGTPLKLPRDATYRYDEKFVEFKQIGLAIFIITCILLYLIVKYNSIFNTLWRDGKAPFIIVLGLSSTIFGLSIKEVILARQLFRLKHRLIA